MTLTLRLSSARVCFDFTPGLHVRWITWDNEGDEGGECVDVGDVGEGCEGDEGGEGVKGREGGRLTLKTDPTRHQLTDLCLIQPPPQIGPSLPNLTSHMWISHSPLQPTCQAHPCLQSTRPSQNLLQKAPSFNTRLSHLGRLSVSENRQPWTQPPVAPNKHSIYP